jgi:hypothetical protein
MALLKYSFSLTPPPAPTPVPAQHQYAYSEFVLDLPTRWRQVPTREDNTLNFECDEDGAALVISAEFYDIPDDKAQALAEQCLSTRIKALHAAGSGPVHVLQQSTQPHTSGTGLELSLAAEVGGDAAHVHLYLGYVTSRKVLHFSMVCRPGPQAAVALFNATVPGFRPRLP